MIFLRKNSGPRDPESITIFIECYKLGGGAGAHLGNMDERSCNFLKMKLNGVSIEKGSRNSVD